MKTVVLFVTKCRPVAVRRDRPAPRCIITMTQPIGWQGSAIIWLSPETQAKKTPEAGPRALVVRDDVDADYICLQLPCISARRASIAFFISSRRACMVA